MIQLTALLLTPVLAATTAIATDAKPAPDDLREIIHGSMADVVARAPGVVIGVVVGDERYIVSYGETGAEGVDPEDALFRVASLTKPITALALARLVNEGALGLDDPAVSCDEHPNLCPGGEAITWRQLATHTAGLPTVPDDMDGAAAGYGEAQLDAYLGRVAIDAEAVGTFDYSTTGYALLGRRLGEVEGMPYETLVRRTILEPLGMGDARFEVAAEEVGRLAVGHRDGEPVDPVVDTGPMAPSGGLWMSATDAMLLIAAHLDPPERWAGTVELALEPHEEVPSFGPSVMALGWRRMAPMGFYWHGGHAEGHHAFIAFGPRFDRGVVVLMNAGVDPSDTVVARMSFGLLARLVAWSPPPAE